MRSSLAFRRSLLLALAMGLPTVAAGQTAAPPNATIYFINLKDGDTVTSPFKVQFGLTGMGIAPAGVDKPNTGHHHLLVDTTLSPDELKQAHRDGRQTPAFRWRADGDHANSATGPTHAAARIGRLVAYTIQSADHVANRHPYGEVKVGPYPNLRVTSTVPGRGT